MPTLPVDRLARAGAAVWKSAICERAAQVERLPWRNEGERTQRVASGAGREALAGLAGALREAGLSAADGVEEVGNERLERMIEEAPVELRTVPLEFQILNGSLSRQRRRQMPAGSGPGALAAKDLLSAETDADPLSDKSASV